MDQITIFDTTLRDGEQSPGFSMSVEQKLRMAKALANLRVDVIEAGFAGASPADFQAVREIAGTVRGPAICSLARCTPGDIRAAGDALTPATRSRIHVFIATSPLHREFKLKMSREAILQAAIEGVKEARDWCRDVEFSAEDAIRTERDYLAQVIEAAIDAGATTVNIPDTVGYSTPDEIRDLFAFLKREVPNIDRATLSAHCHNDLGLAVANSLAAIEGGARQVECAINGIGERAGNCALEEIAMAIATRRDRYQVQTDLDHTQLFPVSRLLAGVTGSIVPRNKAIVGDNAFAHEAGIHQHGVMAHRETYEIMRAQDVGRTQSPLILGKHSGRHALVQRVDELGYDLSSEEIDELFGEFKRLADRKRHVTDADVEALVAGSVDAVSGWELKSFLVSAGPDIANAAVVLTDPEGHERRESSIGDGPVDAMLKAIQRSLDTFVHVRGVVVRSVTEGKDAQGEVELRASFGGQEYSGRAVSTDIVEACALAFLQILNRIERHQTQPGLTRETANLEVSYA